jgi:hypothetical protein
MLSGDDAEGRVGFVGVHGCLLRSGIGRGWRFGDAELHPLDADGDEAGVGHELATERRAGLLRGGGRSGTAPRAPSRSVEGVNCTIKGNINGAGERIYHVPGGASYDETRIDPARGERYFCSEREARDAGWRAPKSRR